MQSSKQSTQQRDVRVCLNAHASAFFEYCYCSSLLLVPMPVQSCCHCVVPGYRPPDHTSQNRPCHNNSHPGDCIQLSTLLLNNNKLSTAQHLLVLSSSTFLDPFSVSPNSMQMPTYRTRHPAHNTKGQHTYSPL
jgi:hypothetical protein